MNLEPKTESTLYEDPETHEKYGNIWVDIPATKGSENWTPIILQAHMDMVVAGVDKTKIAETGIDAVRETIIDPKDSSKKVDVIHSRDYKTSLGGDNGIGVATILSIIQNKNLTHGPIRAVITFDEEDGAAGAKKIVKDGINNVLCYDNIINIDAEVDGGLFTGCYGLCQAKTNLKFNSEDKKIDTGYSTFEIYINGLHGGHSGEDVGFRYANAERLGYEILYELSKDSTKDTHLVNVDHWDYDPTKPAESSYKHNSIIPHASFTINTKYTQDEVKAVFNSLLNNGNELVDPWKTKYSGEDWAINHLEFKADRTGQAKCISNADTLKVASLLGGELSKGYACGVVMIKDEAKHIPAIAGNVGPTEVTRDDSTISMLIKSSARSYDNGIIDALAEGKTVKTAIGKMLSYQYIFDQIFASTPNCSCEVIDKEYAWNDKSNNPLRDILVEGYKKAANMEPTLVSAYGVLEVSGWAIAKPSLNMVSIGPRLENCHTEKETLYLDTLNNEYKAILYALNSMKK